MTIPQLIVIAIIVLPLALIATNRLRLDVAAMLTAITLAVCQLLGIGILGAPGDTNAAIKAISGLAEPVTVTLFALFVITRCLDKTGVARWLARRLLHVSGTSERALIGLLALTAAFFSLFMNNLAAGALVLPAAMEIARRTGIKPSKLLLPVAYGSCLGGAATYFTTANIIASDLLRAANPPQAPLHILDFTPTGGLIALAGILYLTIAGKWIMPDREPSPEQVIVRRTGTELEGTYQIGERLWEIQIQAGSPIANNPLGLSGIGDRLGLTVAAIWRGRQAIYAPPPEQIIQSGDVLLTIGREDRVVQLADKGTTIEREQGRPLSQRGVSFVEVVLAPHSAAENLCLKELGFRRKFGFTAVALQREGRSFRTDVADFKLHAGDSLLVIGDRRGLRTLQNSPDFLVLESDPSDQPVQWRAAIFTIALTIAAIAASILGFPIYLAALIAAVLMIVAGILPMEEIYRTMEWQSIILIAGMYPVSLAMVNTGLAESIGHIVVQIVAPFGPLGLAAGAYLFTALLSQVIAGQVTTLITAPIFISAAISLGTNPQAIAVASAIACSVAFLTPLAHPVNTLMIGPANYRFADFFRAGWLLTILCFLMLILGMKLFWNL